MIFFISYHMRSRFRLERRKILRTLIIGLFLFITSVSSSMAQEAVDGTGGTFARFKSNVLPILNGLMGIACLFGIGKGALEMMGGDNSGNRGSKSLVWVVIGGIIWCAASIIISALNV